MIAHRLQVVMHGILSSLPNCRRHLLLPLGGRRCGLALSGGTCCCRRGSPGRRSGGSSSTGGLYDAIPQGNMLRLGDAAVLPDRILSVIPALVPYAFFGYRSTHRPGIGIHTIPAGDWGGVGIDIGRHFQRKQFGRHIPEEIAGSGTGRGRRMGLAVGNEIGSPHQVLEHVAADAGAIAIAAAIAVVAAVVVVADIARRYALDGQSSGKAEVHLKVHGGGIGKNDDVS
mmetsp:Transcript_6800/g.14926  ORF Transcript_6800/g.14926 Transcript_6800/m.14926 type:complete len:228 (-) Transcript_6800:562-1245(-)